MSKILEMELQPKIHFIIFKHLQRIYIWKITWVFSWEEIEQGYIQKNEINHQRQDNGY